MLLTFTVVYWNNPVKAGFVSEPWDWKHSSDRNYADLDSVIEIDNVAFLGQWFWFATDYRGASLVRNTGGVAAPAGMFFRY